MSMYNADQIREMIQRHVISDGSKRFMETIYQDMECMNGVIEYLAIPFAGKIDAVASPAVSGYILGSMLARELKVPFIPILKGGFTEEEQKKEFFKASYLDHKDLVRSMMIRKDSVSKGEKILLVDNWIETAATINTCQILLDEAEARVEGIAAFGLDYNDATAKLIETGKVRVGVNK